MSALDLSASPVGEPVADLEPLFRAADFLLGVTCQQGCTEDYYAAANAAREAVLQAIWREKKALYAHPSTAVVSEPAREGWVLVPREPTEAMWNAFFEARDTIFPAQMKAKRAEGRGWDGLPAVVWNAMIAALTQQGEETREGGR
jgi:hypothetical protein